MPAAGMPAATATTAPTSTMAAGVPTMRTPLQELRLAQALAAVLVLCLEQLGGLRPHFLRGLGQQARQLLLLNLTVTIHVDVAKIRLRLLLHSISSCLDISTAMCMPAAGMPAATVTTAPTSTMAAGVPTMRTPLQELRLAQALAAVLVLCLE